MGNKKSFFKKTILLVVGLITISMLAAIVSNSGIAGGIKDESTNKAQQDIASKLIRLHVIANSNSDRDQALKLKVRDSIVKALDKEFRAMNNIEDTRNYIKNNLDKIEKIAKREVQGNGENYNVKALFGKFPFPVKTYGYVTLPAGEYEALRVVIGSGKGANWWCVLFPPLCFVDITRDISDDKDSVDIKTFDPYTKGEMMTVTNQKPSEDMDIEVRFKIVEMWQQAKDKINEKFKMALR